MTSPSGISVIVASYGDKDYWDLVAQRAIASVESQSRPPDQLIRVHGESLSQARNDGVQQSATEHCVFLDCDDELDPFYLDQMLLARGDIRYPRIQYLYPDGSRKLVSTGICIGALFLRDLFLKVGGFWDEPILEDLSLWTRMKKAGAIASPSLAIYKAHVRPSGRNANEELKAKWIEIIQTY